MRMRPLFLAALGVIGAAGCGSSGGSSGGPPSQDGGASDGSNDGTVSDGTVTDGTASDGATETGPGLDGGGPDASTVDSGHPGVDSGADGATTDGATPEGAAPDAPSPPVGDSVLQHHKNASRDGAYVQPSFTRAAIGTLHVDPAFTATLSDPNDQVFAQPLFIDGQGVGKDMVLVVTEADNVYALDATTGMQLWGKNFGTPVPLSKMPCGNLDPLGITGTPVVDFASRTMFFDAMTTPDDAGVTKRHLLFALSIDTGDIKAGWPVDVGAKATSGTTTFNTDHQGQRGALALLNGTVYVPYGGLFGDCPTYHGWVVGVSAGDPTQVHAWATAAAAGGAWAPGGVSSDGTQLFVATGNTQSTTTWGGGDAFIELSTSLAMTSYFAPQNWYNLDNGDLDMGSAPIVFTLPGSTPGQLAIQLGKDGNAYLIDRTNPGGLSAALGGSAATCTPTTFSNACASLHVATAEIITAPALYTTATATYVTFRGNGSLCTSGAGGTLTTLKIVPGSPPTLAASWCAPGGAGSPMVTTSNGIADPIVWTLGVYGDNRLEAFDGDTGAPVAFASSTTTISGMRAFNTPIAAKGRIYVPADGKIVAFTL